MIERNEERLPPRRTDEEIATAVADDPDAAPLLTEEDWEAALAREAARDKWGVARLRRRLGVAQIVFADRYRIPLTTLRNWEQGVCEPDRAAKVLLAAISPGASSNGSITSTNTRSSIRPITTRRPSCS